eukprot:1963520-Rhodomonas_salina.1
MHLASKLPCDSARNLGRRHGVECVGLGSLGTGSSLDPRASYSEESSCDPSRDRSRSRARCRHSGVQKMPKV